ncbi:hypothetical protein [Sulfitobacter dubius]|uniref:hypothetical protein n=1 Tax=Sulfitobacter dubius TaxID=218673 RepID=UPI0022B03712|nr:hypothetical protein [Sulfitobacter dubius]MCZ4368704.1 hypothetical protein [Sulfitobacter dubius]
MRKPDDVPVCQQMRDGLASGDTISAQAINIDVSYADFKNCYHQSWMQMVEAGKAQQVIDYIDAVDAGVFV